jgi:ribosome-associated protein
MLKKTTKKNQTEKLVETIVEAILDTKGEEVISLHFDKLENTVCKYFVICHANSNTQVKAIADHVEETARIKLKEKIWHSEGQENAQWVLLDYSDVVVHIFQTQIRYFYNLENLWADAKIKYYKNETEEAQEKPEKKKPVARKKKIVK